MNHQTQNQAEVIDRIFADTWLTVSRLKSGVPVENGQKFFQHACQQVEQARSCLQAEGFSTTDIEHMLYAQCALLDESVMNRSEHDSAYEQWLQSPLQAKYFNTLEAGARLWDRIANSLNDGAAKEAVLVCFHRVLLLGFSGQYRKDDEQYRHDMLEKLGRKVPAYAMSAVQPLTVDAGSGFSRLVRYLLLVLATSGGLLALWWLLSNSLQELLKQLFN